MHSHLYFILPRRTSQCLSEITNSSYVESQLKGHSWEVYKIFGLQKMRLKASRKVRK